MARKLQRRPRPTRIATVLLALTALAGLASAKPARAAGIEIRRVDAQAYPTIRVLVVTPTASATPPTLLDSGQAASGLSAENLAGHENVALVIDNSQSMRGRALADAIRAAHAFVAASPSTDQVSVIAVGSQAATLAGFTAAGVGVDPVLQRLSIDPRYGTVLWDAIVRASAKLRIRPLAGRVIVLVTDGQNTTSRASLQDAIRAARSAEVAVYTVAIPDKWFTPRPLRELAAATGGKYYYTPTTAALPTIYRAIGAELGRTWQLDFATAARPGDTLTLTAEAAGFHTVSKTTLSPNLASKSGTGSASILVATALVLAAVVAIVIVINLRSTALHDRWRRQPPDLY